MSLAVPHHVLAPFDDADLEPLPLYRGFDKFVHPAALGPGLVLASGIAAFSVFSAFLPEYARSIGFAGSGGLFAAYSIVCLLLRLVGARLPERLGARRAVTIAFVTLATALGALATFPAAWALWASATIIGVGMAFMYPSLMALTVNRVDDRERPVVIGSFTMFFEVGTVFGGIVLGTVAQLFGKRVSFGAAVLLCVFGLWLLRSRVAPADRPPTSAPAAPSTSPSPPTDPAPAPAPRPCPKPAHRTSRARTRMVGCCPSTTPVATGPCSAGTVASTVASCPPSPRPASTAARAARP